MQLKRPPRHRWRRGPEGSDAGLALLLAVLIGAVLIAAASALLAVQLAGRRSGASASNRDLAESAASTGVSRIEAQLNAASGDYRYLWEVPSTSWAAATTSAGGSSIRPLLSQPCSFKPIDPAVLSVLQGGSVGGERQDSGAVPITSRYSLRGYSKTDVDWSMQVEGFSERQPNSGAIFARSLLTRRFEVSNIGVPRVGNWEDWAVIAAREMDLGPTKLSNGDGTGTGIGLVQLVLDNTATNRATFAASNSCDGDTLMARVNANDNSLSGRIWPTLNQPVPGSGWFKNYASDGRLLQINDSLPASEQCNIKGVCRISGNHIILPQSNMCPNNSSNLPCAIDILQISLQSQRLLVEAQDRPVILLLKSPSGSPDGSFIKLSSAAQICAVPVGSTTCYSGQPQKLVILGTARDMSTSCADTTSFEPSYLSIEENSLPEALVVLPESTLRLTRRARLTGLVWANRICASPGLTLVTQVGSDSVVKRANDTYAFPNATSGRSLIRARATSIDPYRTWQQ